MDLTTLGEHGEVERRRSFKGHRTSSSIIIGFLFLPKTTNEDTWRSRAFPDPNPLTVCPQRCSRYDLCASAACQLLHRPSALAAVAASLTHPARGRNAYIVHAVLKRS